MKSLIKTSRARAQMADWMVERLPSDYREMTYLEPFLGDGSVFMTKEASKEEILCDPDFGVVNIWRALRDENKLFATRLKKVKYSESTFKRHMSLKTHEDYLSAAVSEFILRQMSKSGLKRSFVQRSDETECRHCWKGLFEIISSLEERIKSSYFLCRDVLEIFGAFNNANTLAYCDMPEVDEDSMPSSKHAEIGERLKNFRGKVVVVGPGNALYRRMYDGWNRKGVPGSAKESVWVNF
jgi:site-specific DNA-adenine methylase